MFAMNIKIGKKCRFDYLILRKITSFSLSSAFHHSDKRLETFHFGVRRQYKTLTNKEIISTVFEQKKLTPKQKKVNPLNKQQ